jgi:hypothetical protein
MRTLCPSFESNNLRMPQYGLPKTIEVYPYHCCRDLSHSEPSAILILIIQFVCFIGYLRGFTLFSNMWRLPIWRYQITLYRALYLAKLSIPFACYLFIPSLFGFVGKVFFPPPYLSSFFIQLSSFLIIHNNIFYEAGT